MGVCGLPCGHSVIAGRARLTSRVECVDCQLAHVAPVRVRAVMEIWKC